MYKLNCVYVVRVHVCVCKRVCLWGGLSIALSVHSLQLLLREAAPKGLGLSVGNGEVNRHFWPSDFSDL